MKRFFAIALLAATLTNVAGALWARDWGARENFAVVNPIVRSENAKVISLSGTWDFSTENPFAYQLGVGEGLWEFLGVPYRPRITRTIEVPGIWQAQGVGEQGRKERTVGRYVGLRGLDDSKPLRRLRVLLQNREDSGRLGRSTRLAQGRRRLISGAILGQRQTRGVRRNALRREKI